MPTGDAFLDAVTEGDLLTIRTLLDSGSDPNTIDEHPERSRWSALNYAIEHDHPAAVDLLIAAGADVSHQSETCWPPLLHAVDLETDSHLQAGCPHDLRMVRRLVEAGADPLHPWVTSDPRRAISPAEAAADWDHPLALEYFASHGAG